MHVHVSLYMYHRWSLGKVNLYFLSDTRCLVQRNIMRLFLSSRIYSYYFYLYLDLLYSMNIFALFLLDPGFLVLVIAHTNVYSNALTWKKIIDLNHARTRMPVAIYT